MTQQAWPIFAIAPSAHNYPFQYAADEIVDLGALLQPGEDLDGGHVRDWALTFVGSEGTDTLTLLKAINEGVHREIRYRRRDEEGTQSASATLVAQSGSCRDLATLFVAAIRHLGIGGRIVSGYLFDPSGYQHGATHAWAEAFLPCAGWITFDPTNAQMGSANLVPVAVAREVNQIMPVSGSYAGTPEDLTEMQVEVSVTRGENAGGRGDL